MRTADVRFGSLADILRCGSHVRSYPESGHWLGHSFKMTLENSPHIEPRRCVARLIDALEKEASMIRTIVIATALVLATPVISNAYSFNYSANYSPNYSANYRPPSATVGSNQKGPVGQKTRLS